MRIRKKKHTDERIQACADYMKWGDMLTKNNSVHMEVGCGKGDFICEMAQKFPEINFIAVEKVPDVIVAAMEKAKNLNLSNVRFVIANIKEFANYIEGDKISVIYLNFSDPWPKRYHQTHRLTDISCLNFYKRFLKSGSEIILKTDDKDFFDFSVKSLSSNGFKIKNMTYDLYNSEFIGGNVQTEYEKNFVGQNMPICYFSAVLI